MIERDGERGERGRDRACHILRGAIMSIRSMIFN